MIFQSLQSFSNWALIIINLFFTEIVLSRSAQVGPFSVIGYGTKIGNNTKISNSVIGEGCNIGSNVSIEGSYIWNNVVIENGCELKHAILCDGVIMKSGAILEPGVVLSFKVFINGYNSNSLKFLILLFCWIPLWCLKYTCLVLYFFISCIGWKCTHLNNPDRLKFL